MQVMWKVHSGLLTANGIVSEKGLHARTKASPREHCCSRYLQGPRGCPDRPRAILRKPLFRVPGQGLRNPQGAYAGHARLLFRRGKESAGDKSQGPRHGRPHGVCFPLLPRVWSPHQRIAGKRRTPTHDAPGKSSCRSHSRKTTFSEAHRFLYHVILLRSSGKRDGGIERYGRFSSAGYHSFSVTRRLARGVIGHMVPRHCGTHVSRVLLLPLSERVVVPLQVPGLQGEMNLILVVLAGIGAAFSALSSTTGSP